MRVLVATGIAARGLDIDQLPHVVNYELPDVPEDDVHRTGRAGLAGNEGHAVLLVFVDGHKLLVDRASAQACSAEGGVCRLRGQFHTARGTGSQERQWCVWWRQARQSFRYPAAWPGRQCASGQCGCGA